MTWTTVAQPAVGAKATAAGFGDQVHDAVAELQTWASGIDPGAPSAPTFAAAWAAMLLREQARPGANCANLTGTGPTSVTAGPTAVVAAPSSGRRIVKSLILGGSAAGATCTLTVSSVDIAKFTWTAPGIVSLDLALPLLSTGALNATVTGGTVTAIGAYVDRGDSLLDRLALASFSGAQTLITAGTARTLTQLWIANPTGTAGSVNVTVGGSSITGGAVSIAAGGVLSFDSPQPITSAQAVAATASGTTLSAFVTGY